MNQPLVTIITPTGHRPEALKLCEKWVRQQSYPQDKINWLIISDDYSQPSMDTYYIYHSSLEWKPGFNTQRIGIMDLLPKVTGDYVFFFEDDDYYSPTYIEEYVYLLQKFDVVGEGNAKYYHLPTKTYKEMNNYDHTSLASLGFKKEVLPFFEEALHSGDKFFDITFWEIVKRENLNTLIFTNKNLSIGIKGMPGRKGIGVGHTPEGYNSDPFTLKFKEWVDKDSEAYNDYIGTKVRKK